MKPFMLLLLLPITLFSGCDKKSAAPTTTYRGVILHSVCCSDVIMSIGSDSIGQDSWIDSNVSSLPVYHHVFKVANPCQFGGQTGDTISFRIITSEVQNCACCMLFAYTPQTSYPIQVVN